ncbi:hypothetical protein [Paludisphaera rhizosphaerae]|uniref:hypothetical protein n=1 Tax=Paludisphaera rhizosphaerae TaxID=2711216 RepID=UPI0013EE1CAE|nr:hypothetical protein [Paludisphaera rhizosphaerae]
MGPTRFRPRLTIRRLMVAVAIAALLTAAGLWIVEMRTRSAFYREKAYELNIMTMRSGRVQWAKDRSRQVNAYDNENDWREDEWACKLAEKYWRLADRPWLPVEPDPPVPRPRAHPRSAVDLPGDYPHWGWNRQPIFPWWTVLWTWRTFPGQSYGRSPAGECARPYTSHSADGEGARPYTSF